MRAKHHLHHHRRTEVGELRYLAPSFSLALKFFNISDNLSTEELLLDLHVVIVRDLTEEDSL